MEIREEARQDTKAATVIDRRYRLKGDHFQYGGYYERKWVRTGV
jgi:hypothetical protein